MKLNKYVDRIELAAFFRRLADALENGATDELECIGEFKKIKIDVKDEFGQLSLKMKVKAADSSAPGENDGDEAACKPKYKDLKKRMKASFKMIVKTVHEGHLPPAEAVGSFLDDSALMVTYPGYGDEYYESYTQACAEFRKAFDSGDIKALSQAVDVLVHEKSRCHAKYD